MADELVNLVDDPTRVMSECPNYGNERATGVHDMGPDVFRAIFDELEQLEASERRVLLGIDPEARHTRGDRNPQSSFGVP